MLRGLEIPLATLFAVVAAIALPFGIIEWSSANEARNWKEFSSQHDCEQVYNVLSNDRSSSLRLYLCGNKFYYIR